MTPAERIFVEIWNRLTSDWSRLTTFRQMGVLGEDAARDAIHRSNTYFVQQQLLHGQHQNLLKDRAGFIEAGLADSMPNAMTESAVKNFRSTLHASTLVFAHSILDAAIYDCLRICAISCPNEWAPQLSSKKVTLSDVSSKSYSDILNEVIATELKRLERESLIVKVDKTFQLCKPKLQQYLTNGFRFDRDRLLRLDELRHKVVHAPGASADFNSIYEDLQFMQSSGLHIFSMLGDTFNLQFSASETLEILGTSRMASGE